MKEHGEQRAVARVRTRRASPTRELRAAIVDSLARSPLAVVAVIDCRADVLADYEADLRDSILGDPRVASSRVPVALGLAVHEIEAWMLADPESRRAAFGDAHDPKLSDHEADPDPKSTWANLDGRSADLPSPRKEWSYLRRMAAIDALRPDVVARACPRGFAPFLAQFRDRILPVLRR